MRERVRGVGQGRGGERRRLRTLEGYNDGPSPPQTRRCMTVLGPAQVTIQGGTFWFPDYPENPLATARKIYKEQSAWLSTQGGPTKCEAFGFQP